MRKILNLVILIFMCSSAYASTTVRCYFPGYSEVFKDVQNKTRMQLDATVMKFTINSKEYTVPVNACVVEEDL